MKKSIELLLLFIVVAIPVRLRSQDIQVTKFERNYTSLVASMHPAYDNTGEACAVIRFYMRDKKFEITPNLGVVKMRVYNDHVRMWVPKGTKRLTISHKGLMSLTGYEIPVEIQPKVTYDVTIEVTDAAIKRRRANQGHNVYMGLGYNIMSVSGPSLSLGANLNHHNIELGVVYGLNKTDDLFFYDSEGNTMAGYNYKAICAQLRYGYEIPCSDFFAITPLIGASYNFYTGSDVSGVSNVGTYKNGNSLSVLGGLRFTVAFSNIFKLSITPEYHGGVYKDNTCKIVSQYDDSLKSWHSGFNLNAGFLIFF